MPVEFSRKPVTLGDHLRRRRIELELYQKNVAAMLGVTTPTVWNWENRGSIDLRFIPRIIAFFGYNPIPQPEDLLERLAWHKMANGLTLEQLGVEMGRGPEQLADWLSGRHQPCQRNREEIADFLAEEGGAPPPSGPNNLELYRACPRISKFQHHRYKKTVTGHTMTSIGQFKSK